jgi:hypothetical protein
VVSTDVVRVSEPAVCTLKLSVRVFTPLPDGSEKTQNPGSDILNLGSRKFLYITAGSFGIGGRGKVFISTFGAVGEGCDLTVIPFLRTATMLCGDQVLVCTPGRCRNRGGRPLLHRPLLPPPPKTPVIDR